MDADDLKRMAVQLMAVAELLDERSKRAVQQVEQSTADLGRAAHGLGHDAQALSREALKGIRSEAGAALEQGLGPATKRCDEQLRASAKTVAAAVDALDGATRGLRSQQQRLVWTGLAALAVGSLLAAGGSSLLVWKNMRELERAEFGNDILSATRSGRLTRCGDTLCAQVGAQPKRYGAKGEYLLLGE